MPSDLIQKRLHQLAQLSEKLHAGKGRPDSFTGSPAATSRSRDTKPPPRADCGAGGDPLGLLIGSLERQLNAIELELTAYLEGDIALEDGGRFRLGYDRSPEWGLVYRMAEGDERWEEPQPLLNAPESIRLRALPVLPKLLSALVTAAEKALGEPPAHPTP